MLQVQVDCSAHDYEPEFYARMPYYLMITENAACEEHIHWRLVAMSMSLSKFYAKHHILAFI